jgi:hypothetical protein
MKHPEESQELARDTARCCKGLERRPGQEVDTETVGQSTLSGGIREVSLSDSIEDGGRGVVYPLAPLS